jgi:ribonuclease HI
MLPKIKNNIKQTASKIYPEFDFQMNFDGCSRGNPGLSGAGAVIYHDNDEIWSGSFFVGEQSTNNHAEYAGLILGMQQAIQLKIKNLLIKGDSQLVINQMEGKYKCSSPNLIQLYEKAKEMESEFDNIHYQHIYRNENKRADYLSNFAVDEYLLTKSLMCLPKDK